MRFAGRDTALYVFRRQPIAAAVVGEDFVAGFRGPSPLVELSRRAETAVSLAALEDDDALLEEATVGATNLAEQDMVALRVTFRLALAVSDGSNWRWPDGAVVS